MIHHDQIESEDLRDLIKKGKITLAGNLRLKIYDSLGCRSGKRMKKENRLFFKSGAEAVGAGFRPCGNCMNSCYLEWRLTEIYLPISKKQVEQPHKTNHL